MRVFNKKETFRRRIIFIIVVIVALWFIVMRLSPIALPISRFYLRIQQIVFSGGMLLKSFFIDDMSIEQLRVDNSALHDENRRLLEENVNIELLRRENEELKKLLEYKNGARVELVSARVVGHPSEEIAKAWIIDRGLEDGIKPGQPVVGNGSFLVGIVETAKRSSAVITLVQDNQFHVGGMTVSASRTNGLIKGSFGTGITMNLIPKTEHIEPGELVITSGIEELIPKGLIIGKIKEITTKSNDLFQSAVIVQDENLHFLSFVGVIISQL